MTRRAVVVAALLSCLILPATSAAAPWSAPRFYTNAPRYMEGEAVTLKLRHDQHTRVARMDETWDIVDEAGNVVAQYYWPDDLRWLPPHQYRSWQWNQRQACAGECQNVWEGEPVPPGRYRVVATVDGKEVSKAFSIGAYFHIAFEGRPNADFVVYANDAGLIDEMRAELDRPEEERQFITGTVRVREPGYNAPWSFVLGPPTLDLAEASIEVCDGSPYYVEHHLEQWRDQTWCPWSSHVASEGI